jgi:hypothetical protein
MDVRVLERSRNAAVNSQEREPLENVNKTMTAQRGESDFRPVGDYKILIQLSRGSRPCLLIDGPLGLNAVRKLHSPLQP